MIVSSPTDTKMHDFPVETSKVHQNAFLCTDLGHIHHIIHSQELPDIMTFYTELPDVMTHLTALCDIILYRAHGREINQF